MNYFIFLPQFKNIQSIIHRIYNESEKLQIYLNDLYGPTNSINEIAEPTWIQDFDKFHKIELQKQIKSSTNKIQQISKYEQLLYTH